MSFASIGLPSWMVESLKNVAITSPSAIQKACIPPILDGKFLLNIKPKKKKYLIQNSKKIFTNIIFPVYDKGEIVLVVQKLVLVKPLPLQPQ